MRGHGGWVVPSSSSLPVSSFLLCDLRCHGSEQTRAWKMQKILMGACCFGATHTTTILPGWDVTSSSTCSLDR
jgi:hypothetical protein